MVRHKIQLNFNRKIIVFHKLFKPNIPKTISCSLKNSFLYGSARKHLKVQAEIQKKINAGYVKDFVLKMKFRNMENVTVFRFRPKILKK